MANDGTQLLEELMRFRPEGMTANAWAVRAGVGRTIWSDIRRHGNPSRRTLSKLLEAAGSSLAEFEALRIGTARSEGPAPGQVADGRRTWVQAAIPPIPLFRTRSAGHWGTRKIELIRIDYEVVVDRLTRPPSLLADRDAYAVTVSGESMWPRFRQGRQIAVTPSTEAGIGDDLLLLLSGDQGAMIGELLFRGSESITLRQFNPAMEFEVPLTEVIGMHRVPGELL